MSLLENLPHPWAIPGTAPTADEVDVAMREIPGFRNLMTEIKSCATLYKSLKKAECELAIDDIFYEPTAIAGVDSPRVKNKRKAIEIDLNIVDKQIKVLMNRYLDMFHEEYVKHGGHELRMWSFPTLVWQHYQNMFCDVTGQQPEFALEECFNDGNVDPGSKWNHWVKEQAGAAPPSLIIFGNGSIEYEDSQGIEWEMHMANGHGEIVQTIYHVYCGPRLCGTRVDGGPEVTCKHHDHSHQFTKRPREWQPGYGWIFDNPYRYNHTIPPPPFESWKPYFAPSIYTASMAVLDQNYARRINEEFHEAKELADIPSQEWVNGIPEEAEPPVVGTPSVSSSSAESQKK